MTVIISLINWAQDLLEKILEAVGFIGPLLLRLYLVPIFWIAGTKKIGSMESTIEWFGNPEWGLGLPFPTLMAWMASLTEAGGANSIVVWTRCAVDLNSAHGYDGCCGL